ncbi:hypothetical protein NHX12_001111 [Muraenolepis orangiensis]|uniref:Uncharacterized protein n=1 Tax=Muraenolepis orangiensis TaxID=630683 RepID=A0A9Q0E1U1_9TELE|nr:hypothetical protein NHX12_001111 [Muraenolepis orangiensis]
MIAYLQILSSCVLNLPTGCRPLQDHGSLDHEDPDILLAIQLSLQDSGTRGGRPPADEARPGAVGSSLPSGPERSVRGPAVLPGASLSSSEPPELAGIDLGAGEYSATAAGHRHRLRRYSGSVPFPAAPRGGGCGGSSTGLFSLSSNTLDSPAASDGRDPSSLSGADAGTSGADAGTSGADAGTSGNIMAWFHDMNPHGMAPSDAHLDALHHQAGGGGGVYLEVKRMASAPLSDDTKLREGDTPLGDTPEGDSAYEQLASSSSSEWEEQIHVM